MGEVMREAAFSLAEAKFTAGDFRYDYKEKNILLDYLFNPLGTKFAAFSYWLVGVGKP